MKANPTTVVYIKAALTTLISTVEEKIKEASVCSKDDKLNDKALGYFKKLEQEHIDTAIELRGIRDSLKGENND